MSDKPAASSPPPPSQMSSEEFKAAIAAATSREGPGADAFRLLLLFKATIDVEPHLQLDTLKQGVELFRLQVIERTCLAMLNALKEIPLDDRRDPATHESLITYFAFQAHERLPKVARILGTLIEGCEKHHRAAAASASTAEEEPKS